MTTSFACPSCGSPMVAPGPSCPACGLPLTGPLAGELWRTDQQLAGLLHHRELLLAQLRQGAGLSALPAPAAPAGSAGSAGAGLARPHPNLTGQQILLVVGALLVLTAAAVFLAVAWSVIGVGGQVSVMAALTFVAGGASLVLVRRGLTATAETLGVLAVGLAAVDLAAAHTLDLAGLRAVDRLWFGTGAALLLAVGCAGTAWWAPRLRVYGIAAVTVGACVPVLALGAAEARAVVVAAVCLLACAAATGTRGRLGPRWSAARTTLGAVAIGYLAATWTSATGPVLDQPALGAGGLAALVALAASVGAGWWAGLHLGPRRTRYPVLGWAAVGAAVLTITGYAGQVDRSSVLVSVLAGAAAVLGGVLTWSRRDLTDHPVGVAAIGLHLLAAAGLAVGTGHYLDSPVLDRSTLWGAVTAALVVTTTAAAVTGWRRPGLRAPATGTAAVLALISVVVATAPSGPPSTTVALVAVAVLAALLAGLRRDLGEEPVLGGAWAVAVLLAVGSAASSEPAAELLALTLATAGLTAFGYGVLPRRGSAAVLGALLCSAAVWTLLADRSVRTVEAYSLPLAALIAVVGVVRLRREPGAPSWLTIGPALTVALLPSAVVSVDDPALTRPLLVLAAGALVLVLGVRTRWQAPVTTGAVALAIVAVSQLAPYAVGLPRWLSFGAVGLALLGLGARYEQRRRNARQALTWVSGLH